MIDNTDIILTTDSPCHQRDAGSDDAPAEDDDDAAVMMMAMMMSMSITSGLLVMVFINEDDYRGRDAGADREGDKSHGDCLRGVGDEERTMMTLQRLLTLIKLICD